MRKKSNVRFRFKFGGNETILVDELVLPLLVIIAIGLCERLGGEAK